MANNKSHAKVSEEKPLLVSYDNHLPRCTCSCAFHYCRSVQIIVCSLLFSINRPHNLFHFAAPVACRLVELSQRVKPLGGPPVTTKIWTVTVRARLPVITRRMYSAVREQSAFDFIVTCNAASYQIYELCHDHARFESCSRDLSELRFGEPS